MHVKGMYHHDILHVYKTIMNYAECCEVTEDMLIRNYPKMSFSQVCDASYCIHMHANICNQTNKSMLNCF